jgi:hypothetical protein
VSLPYGEAGDYEWQINGSKQDIIDNLTLPALWRNGNLQYVYAWIEPFGQYDETTRQLLGASGYLCDRTVASNEAINYSFDEWDEYNGLFYPSGYSVEMGNPSWNGNWTSVQLLNRVFDNAYEAGGIYHLIAHPASVNWSIGGYADQHTTYISNRTDVWYVPFGLLYLYHWMATRDIVQVASLVNGNQQEFAISINSTNHLTYGAAYPLTYVFNIPSDWTGVYAYCCNKQSGPWVPVESMNSSDFFNGVSAVRFDANDHKAYVSVPFGNSSDDIFLKILRSPMPSINLNPSGLSVERGRNTSAILSVGLKNSGINIVYSPSISVVDSIGLQINPAQVNLTDIAGQGTGSAEFSVVAPSTVQLGSDNVAFQINYVDFTGSPQTETWDAPVTITKLGANVKFAVNPSSVKKGGTIELNAALFDDNANPIPGQSVSFLAAGSFLGSATTDLAGNAMFRYVVNSDAGNKVLTAVFNGSQNFSTAEATLNFTVWRINTNLTLDVPELTFDNTAMLSAVLTDENGNLLRNASLEFQVYGKNNWSSTAYAETDVNGLASINYSFPKTGDLRVKAFFNGTINYADSISVIKSIRVYPSNYILYLNASVVASALAGVAVGIIMFRNRRKKAC